MDLEFVAVSRDGREKWAPPFDEHDGFNDGWWNMTMGEAPTSSYLQVFRNGTEVARVELDDDTDISHYAGTPDLGEAGLRIVFFEVSDEHRRQGIGTAVIRHLAELHPDRRLIAFSEADDFWSKLKWLPHFHSGEGPDCQVLFIQP